MRLWRLTRAAYQRLDGEGARLNGGRWNSEGNAVVYLSSTLSLAALELLVHVDLEDAPRDLVALAVDLPDDIGMQSVDPSDLPDDWRDVPDHPACVARGDAWLAAGDALLLRVPSAVIPDEMNYLLNPRHAGAATATISPASPFEFDPRLVVRFGG